MEKSKLCLVRTWEGKAADGAGLGKFKMVPKELVEAILVEVPSWQLMGKVARLSKDFYEWIWGATEGDLKKTPLFRRVMREGKLTEGGGGVDTAVV